MKLLSARIRLVLAENPDLEGDQGQAGLARAAGASKSVVNQWLDDKIKTLNIEYALNIEKSLGYNHLWLMLGDPYSKKIERQRPSSHLARIDDKELELLADYRMATEDGKDMIEKVAKAAQKSHPIDSLIVVGDKP